MKLTGTLLLAALSLTCNKSEKGSPNATNVALEGPAPKAMSLDFQETIDWVSPERHHVTLQAEGEVVIRADREAEVPGFADGTWYENGVAESLRNAVRDSAAKSSVAEIEAARETVAKDALAALSNDFASSPFDIKSLRIVKVELPRQYVDALRAREQNGRDVENATLEAERLVAEMRAEQDAKAALWRALEKELDKVESSEDRAAACSQTKPELVGLMSKLAMAKEEAKPLQDRIDAACP